MDERERREIIADCIRAHDSDVVDIRRQALLISRCYYGTVGCTPWGGLVEHTPACVLRRELLRAPTPRCDDTGREDRELSEPDEDGATAGRVSDGSRQRDELSCERCGRYSTARVCWTCSEARH